MEHVSLFAILEIILENSLAILARKLHLSTNPETTDTLNCTCCFGKIIPIYFHREILSIAGYPREESRDSLIPEISDEISCS